MGVNMIKALETQGAEITITIEKSITLAIIDMYWKEHLRAMDDLRHNVHFASHEQKDPLLIYKLESYDLFKNMLAKMNGEIVQFLMTCRIEDNTPTQVQSNRPAPSAPKTIETKAESQNLAERSSPTHRPSAGPEPVKVEPVRADPKVGRNDPCPCGSGKKYKSCHGAI
jgi:preprotein translocase subunit SecA